MKNIWNEYYWIVYLYYYYTENLFIHYTIFYQVRNYILFLFHIRLYIIIPILTVSSREIETTCDIEKLMKFFEKVYSAYSKILKYSNI